MEKSHLIKVTDRILKCYEILMGISLGVRVVLHRRLVDRPTPCAYIVHCFFLPYVCPPPLYTCRENHLFLRDSYVHPSTPYLPPVYPHTFWKALITNPRVIISLVGDSFPSIELRKCFFSIQVDFFFSSYIWGKKVFRFLSSKDC